MKSSNTFVMTCCSENEHQWVNEWMHAFPCCLLSVCWMWPVGGLEQLVGADCQHVNLLYSGNVTPNDSPSPE